MRQLAYLLFALGLVISNPFYASAVVIDFGDAADFAALAMPDGSDDPDMLLFASVKITGDVGVGPDGSFDMNSSGIGRGIFGDVLLSPGVTQSISSSANITGSVLTGQNLSQAITDAQQVSSTVGALTATQTFGTITSSTTWNATASDGQNVIDVTTIDLGSTDTLTLNGSASDFFLINVSTDFDMTASSQIVTSGGIDPSHVLFNFPGSGSDVHMSSNASAIGSFVAPHRDIHWDGLLVSGAVFGNDIRMGSSAELYNIPFERRPPPPVIPEPASSLLLGFGLLGMGGFARRRRLSSPPHSN